MSRGVESHIVDMLAACDVIAEYRQGFTRESFARDRRTVDAVARNLEILGEAAKMIPESVRALAPDIAWRQLAGLRDILIHAYFVVDVEILWDAAAARVPKLRVDLEELRQRIAAEP